MSETASSVPHRISLLHPKIWTWEEVTSQGDRAVECGSASCWVATRKFNASPGLQKSSSLQVHIRSSRPIRELRFNGVVLLEETKRNLSHASDRAGNSVQEPVDECVTSASFVSCVATFEILPHLNNRNTIAIPWETCANLGTLPSSDLALDPNSRDGTGDAFSSTHPLSSEPPDAPLAPLLDIFLEVYP